MTYELGLKKDKISKYSDEASYFYLMKQNKKLSVQIFLEYGLQTMVALTN